MLVIVSTVIVPDLPMIISMLTVLVFMPMAPVIVMLVVITMRLGGDRSMGMNVVRLMPGPHPDDGPLGTPPDLHACHTASVMTIHRLA